MPAVADLVIASAMVRSGKLFIRNRRAFDGQIAQMKDGWELELTLRRRRATRSVQANAYYWGVVLHLISEHTGDTPDDLHDYFKQRFLPKPLAIARDEAQKVIGGSTRHLNTIEFGTYVDQIRQFASEFLDCYIPDANEAPL